MSFGPTSLGVLDSNSYFQPEHPPCLAPIRKKSFLQSRTFRFAGIFENLRGPLSKYN